MTFTEIVTEITDRLNLSSATAVARVGRSVNVHYRRVTSSIGVQVGRRLSSPVTEACTLGSTLVTFSGIEKIERVIDDTSGSVTVLEEVSEDDLRRANPGDGDPTQFSIVNMGPGTVTIRLNSLMQDERELKADGLATATTLSGSQEPQFPTSFHDILVEAVLADEYRKIDEPTQAGIAAGTASKRLSELRLFIAKSSAQSVRQGGAQQNGFVGTGASSGSAPSGGTSWTQTGLVTFDRDPSAPFAVSSGSAVVPNLDADKLDGLDSTAFAQLPIDLAADVTGDLPFANIAQIATDRLLGRDTAGTGDIEALTVGGGIEFTASGGIQTSAFTGDVTKSAGGTAQTIANDAVTYAKMQNVSAASKLLGRGSASGAGDPEEITLGTGLSMSGTTLNATSVAGSDTQVQFNDGGALAGDSGLTFAKTTDTLTLAGPLVISGASAGQIVFPASQNASSNANTLDDYEEGTWTPTDASGAALSFTSVEGTYVKIGQMVHVEAILTYPSTADGSTAILGSLPFTVKDTTGDFALGLMMQTSGTMIGLAGLNNTTTVQPRNPASFAAFTNANLSTLVVRISMTYRASA